jgi:hypothetical protein
MLEQPRLLAASLSVSRIFTSKRVMQVESQCSVFCSASPRIPFCSVLFCSEDQLAKTPKFWEERLFFFGAPQQFPLRPLWVMELFQLDLHLCLRSQWLRPHPHTSARRLRPWWTLPCKLRVHLYTLCIRYYYLKGGAGFDSKAGHWCFRGVPQSEAWAWKCSG